MADSRQVRRAKARAEKKQAGLNYPMKAQKGGPSMLLIHRNRQHRSDGKDYF